MSENNSQNDNDEPSLRDALSAGFDDESGAAGGAQSDKTAGAGSSSAPAASPAAAPATSAAPAPGYLDGAAPKQPPGNIPPSQHAAPELKPGVGGLPTPSTVRAPTSWRPEVREKFNALPPEVQQEVVRREREVARVMADSAEARRTAEAFTRTAAPYQHLIAMEGGDAVQAFDNYLRTVTVLRAGTQVEKANALAQVALKFGVDVNYLDVALTRQLGGNAQMPQGQQFQQPQSPQQFRDPRLDGILTAMEQRRATEEQQINESATTDIEQFAADPKNEFLADVRLDMADMLDMAAKRGRVMPLSEAYQRACALHPEISKVLDQRRIAENVAAQQPMLNGKRRAAVSITSSSSRSGGNSDKPLSVREALESSIDQLGVG